MTDTMKAPTAHPNAPGRRPRDIVEDAFGLLGPDLTGFVDRVMRVRHFAGDNWHGIATRFWLGDKRRDDPGNLLRLMTENWACFSDMLDPQVRATVHELRAVRKDLASRRPFTVTQATNAVEEIASLLDAAGADGRGAVAGVVEALTGTDLGRDPIRVLAKPVANPVQPVVRIRQEIRNESMRAGWIDRVVSHFGTRYELAGTVHLETSARGVRLLPAS
jgi:hypothetical protein